MMRKYFPLLLLMIILVGFSACEKEEKTTNVKLHFKAFFNDAPLQMYEAEYDYAEGMKMRFQLFQFYIADVALIKQDGSEKLIDVELVSFKDVQSLDDANKGVHFLIENVPIGKYQGIRFTLGLTEELNGSQPSDYVAGHPLSDNYWSWATGYIFMKIEGNADLDGDGEYEEKLTYHTGHNDFAQVKTFNREITLEQNRTADIFFGVDVADILITDSTFVDFRLTPQDHTTDKDLAGFLFANLVNSISMQSE